MFQIVESLKDYCKKHKSTIIWWVGIIALFVVFTIICFLPYRLTQEGDFGIDFSDTGQIGDTLGGIMGPFVAMVAAVLTFIAFWVQYKANEQQKAEIERQDKRHKREQFEAQLYKMLDEYKDNASRLSAGKFKGKDAVPEFLAEISYIYSCIYYAYAQLVKTKEFKYTRDNYQVAVWYYLSQSYNSLEKCFENFAILAYSLFFYGRPYFSYKTAKDVGRSSFETEIYERLSEIPFNKAEVYYTQYMYDDFWLKKLPDQNTAHYRMMSGHNDQLGVYFRQLYQIASFIAYADEEIVDENQKYRYAKLLRSQMTDSEQILLFYNSLSEMGSAWNNRTEGEIRSVKDMGLLARFLMIKNIPSNFPFFGISPTSVFKEEKKFWEYNLHKGFYEHDTFAMNGNSVDPEKIKKDLGIKN